jgi:molybdopterin molybdotransferase
VIPVEEALAIVLAHVPLLPVEDAALDEALGRILREDVPADADLPPFDRSAMDGYALCSEEVRQAPVRLPVAGQLRAGQFPEAPLPRGAAVQIMTGAPVPPGADAVQQVEKTRPSPDGATVLILEAVRAGQNVAPRGSEVRAGDTVLEAGQALGPAALAVLAAVGRSRVAVGRRPRVAVAVTGDELVEAGEHAAPGRIRNSNGPAVTAQARLAGAEVRTLGVVPDREDAIAGAVEAGLAGDVLVLSGGVSAGAYDLVEGVLARFAVDLLFTKVAIKPGAPLVFGRRGTTLVFGLPGNPVSAQVTFDLFARAALLRMQGARAVSRPTVVAELAGPLANRSGRRAHLPARLRFEEGRFRATPLRSMGSGDLVAHARANALLVLGAERPEAQAGERVDAVLLAPFLEGT